MQSFSIVPYRGALPIELGSNEDQVEAILGAPKVKSTNCQGLREHFFECCNVAYDSEGKVVHIGLPQIVRLYIAVSTRSATLPLGKC
jgi:hypothetical protein